MNKNLLIGFGIFIAVIVVGFFLVMGIKPKTQSQNQTSVASGNIVANAPTKEFSVSATEYAFSPSTITVNKGDNVKINFINKGTTSHNFTITDLNVATKTINPGETDSITFNAPNSGTFTYFCSIDGHRGFGMQGNLEVK